MKTDPKEAADAKYCLPAGGNADSGLNVSYILYRRLCGDCQTEFDLERATTESPAALKTRLRTCCSKKAGYLRAKRPISEMALRVLAAAKQPMTARQIAARIRLSEAAGERFVDELIVEELLRSDPSLFKQR